MFQIDILKLLNYLYKYMDLKEKKKDTNKKAAPGNPERLNQTKPTTYYENIL